MDERNEVFLRHILEALNRITAYNAKGRETFLREQMVQDAILRNPEIVGEATKNLSPALRASRSRIPWAEMMGMLDIFIHRYAAVDLEIVWEVVENRVPPLAERILFLLQRSERA